MDNRRARALLVLLLTAWPLLALPAPLAGAAEGDVVLETADYVVTEIGGAPRPLGGSAVSLSLADNEVTSAFSLGFTTRFFGRATDLFWVGSNGFVTLHFLTPDGCCEGQALPTRGGPDGMIAAFWTDLNPAAGGAIRFEQTRLENQSALIVDYADVPVVGANRTASFQVVLFQNGTFEIRIAQAGTEGGRLFSVGAENIDATLGVQVMRTAGAVSGVGFRFTPILPPPQPPRIDFVSPTSGPAHSIARVVGAHFEPGATVGVGGLAASTFFESDTSLLFQVPGLPEGVFNVTVTNPDGNATTLPNAFRVVEVLRLDGVSPRSVRQADSFAAFGAGFGRDSVLLVGDVPVETTLVDGGFLFATLPARFPPGLHDVAVFDPRMGVARLDDALLVRGRPDLVLAALEVDRPAVGTTLAPVSADLPTPWTVRALVRNDGDATAEGLNITVFVSGDDGLLGFPQAYRGESISFETPSLKPGEKWETSFSWGNGLDVGDRRFTAFVFDGPFDDRDRDNNLATARASAYVEGLGGIRPDPCALPQACMPPEWRHHQEEVRRQTDNHTRATLRLDADMASADFDFGNFPKVFSRTVDLPDGGVLDCTTWRFLGGPSGFLRVTMRAGNGIQGVATIEEALSRSSEGTVSKREWSDLRAFGVILWETDAQTTDEAPSGPLTRYAFDDAPSASWSLVATGLTGDFTHCSERTASGSVERFTYAALPADVEREVASFEGAGLAERVTVAFEGSIRQETSQPLLPLPWG